MRDDSYHIPATDRAPGAGSALGPPEAEERYRLLFDAIDQGFCVLQMICAERDGSVDFRFIDVNPAFEQQSGIATAQGRTLREVLPDIEPVWLETYSAVAITGESRRFVHHASALARWFDVHAFRVGRPQQRMIAVLFNDVTEQQHGQQRLHGAFQIKTVSVLFWGEGFKLVDANDAFLSMSGFSREEALGLTWQELTPAEFYPQSLKAVEEVLTRGETTPYEKQYFRKDGSRWWGLFAARRVGDEVVEFVLDVTERREAEAALRAADRRKDEFLATLAHELRNPLAALAAAAQLLRKPSQKPEIVDMARDALTRQVEHMARLLDDLLDVARVSHGLIQLRLQTVVLQDAIRTAIQTVQPQLDGKKHRLTLHLPERPVPVNGDSVRLSQVIGNLLSNSAKYTPASGEIDVHLKLDGSRAIVTVRDNGIGISEDMLPRVFEMFSRGNHSIHNPASGLGIGLALVKALVEMHRGNIEVTSEGIGKGAEFSVCLPIADTPTRTTERTPAALEASSRSLRILIADDNTDSAISWATILQQAGHQVRTAFNGADALREFAELKPDVALLDIGMPELDGYQLARKIRSERGGRSVVLVAITGYGQAQDRARAFEAGFDHHFTKPVKYADLQQVLAEAAKDERSVPRA